MVTKLERTSMPLMMTAALIKSFVVLAMRSIGTPPRLTIPPGPDRHLEPGDVVTCWIEGIGELTSTVA